MSDTVIEIEIGNTFYQYVDAAIVRMMALQPEVQLTFEQPKCQLSALMMKIKIRFARTFLTSCIAKRFTKILFQYGRQSWVFNALTL